MQSRASDGDCSEPPIPPGLREIQFGGSRRLEHISPDLDGLTARPVSPRTEPWAAVAIRTVVPLGTDTSPDAAVTN